MASTQPLRVFVSHSSVDDVYCREIVKALRDAGAHVWYDEHNMDSGRLADVILRELGSRPIFVVMLSKAAIASKWVKREFDWAEELADRDPTRVILPVTAGPLQREDFDAANGWLAYYTYKRVEAHSMQPYPVKEAANRVLRALALIPIGLSDAPAGPQPQESVDDLLARGKALRAQKQHATALPLFERAAQLDPGSANAWFTLGLTLNELDRYVEALPAHERATTLDPNLAAAWSNKGIALRHLERADEALAAYDRALALDPNLANAWLNKGIALGMRGHDAEAVAAFDHALAIDPGLVPAWYNQGVAYCNLERYPEALAALDHALALDPMLATAWANKGIALVSLGRYEHALTAFDRALTLLPASWVVWLGRSTALQGLERMPEAHAAEQRAKELGWQF